MNSLALVKAQATMFIAEVPLLKHWQSRSSWSQRRALSSPQSTKYLYSVEMPKKPHLMTAIPWSHISDLWILL